MGTRNCAKTTLALSITFGGVGYFNKFQLAPGAQFVLVLSNYASIFKFDNI